MIGKEQFAKMKRTAILINTCRGPVVVEDDLIEALESGVSRTIIAGIWVAFFSRCQRYSCGQDTHGIRSAAAALSESGAWRLRHKSEPSAYMPLNPIPEENAKRIRYLVFEVLE